MLHIKYRPLNFKEIVGHKEIVNSLESLLSKEDMPHTFLFSGPSGTGKTTLAKELAPLIDAVILSTDKIRKQLIAKPTYERHERELIYDVMTLIAKYLQSFLGDILNYPSWLKDF